MIFSIILLPVNFFLENHRATIQNGGFDTNITYEKQRTHFTTIYFIVSLQNDKLRQHKSTQLITYILFVFLKTFIYLKNQKLEGFELIFYIYTNRFFFFFM